MKNKIGAIILIVFGVIFLLANLGIANLNLGALLAKWWPLILIAFGVGMLFKRG
jgi:lia operon protein LiaF